MSAPDDGHASEHGPKQGCTYQACGNPSSQYACPFVKDELSKDAIARKQSQNKSTTAHSHEYVLVCSCGDIKPITTSNTQHGIVTVHNRGEKWMD